MNKNKVKQDEARRGRVDHQSSKTANPTLLVRSASLPIWVVLTNINRSKIIPIIFVYFYSKRNIFS